ncbi:trigger factor family protein [Candidatus Gracilibacteria bacterium]|nr:trigger factor family protein [Candidatus Gracilibacteria bacterium]
MSKVISAKIEGDVQYKMHYKISNEEYSVWLQRLTNQYYDVVEVPGFRKGKAPKHLVEQQISTQALEQTLLKESLEKYTQEALVEAQKDLKEKKRVALLTTFVVVPDSVKKTDSFEFVLQADLLPEIDFGFLDKIKVARPSEKDLPNRMSEKEFVAKEKRSFITSHNVLKLSRVVKQKMVMRLLWIGQVKLTKKGG